MHTKSQCYRPCGFRQEDFLLYLANISLCKHATPRFMQFWSYGHNLSKLGRQGFATYILKIYFSPSDLDMQGTETI